jgi:putative transcriptional regulator
VRNTLKKKRLEMGKTQLELSQVLGISYSYVRKLERGEVKPGRDTMFKYESYFETPAKELFSDIFF